MQQKGTEWDRGSKGQEFGGDVFVVSLRNDQAALVLLRVIIRVIFTFPKGEFWKRVEY